MEGGNVELFGPVRELQISGGRGLTVTWDHFHRVAGRERGGTGKDPMWDRNVSMKHRT